jgi:PAS domain S-box-containing protein
MAESHRSPAEPGGEPLGQEADKNLLIQQALNAILRISLEPISLDEQMHRVLDLLLKLPWLALEARGCIFLVENDASALALKAHIGMPAGVLSACSRVRFGTCLCGRAIAANQVVFANCVDACHSILYPGIQPHGHYCVPISSGGRRVGLLNLYVREGHQQSPTEERFLRAVADVLAGVIEHQRTQERLGEQLRLAAFGRDVGLALSQGDRLPDMLRQCAEAMVRHLDGAFARLWTLNEAEDVLELQASAGLYTHTDGAHRRVPVGRYKIGLIARERKPHLTNDVLHDPRVHDQGWAGREGLVAFAGYPLLVEDRLVGVMAMFARHPLSQATLDAMASVANGIAIGVERKQAERAVRDSEARKAAILETALDGIITIDHQGRILEFNPAAERTFGFRRAEVVGRHMAELLVPPPLREQYDQGWDRYLASGEGPVLNRRVEMPALRADGTEFPVELAVTRITTAGPPLFTAYVRDITDRKRLERRRGARLALTQILGEAATLQEAAPRIVQAVCEGLGWDAGAFWTPDPHAGVLRCLESWHLPTVPEAAWGAFCRGQTFPPGVGLPGRVWNSGRPAWVADVSKGAPGPPAPVVAPEWAHGAVGCPVRLGGETLGVLGFFSHEVREADDDLLEMMATIGGQIGQFMKRWQTKRRQAAEHAVSQILAASSSLADAAPAILRAVCESLGWDVGIVWAVDRGVNVLRCVEVWHSPEAGVTAFEQDTRERTFPPGAGLPGQVWSGQTLAWVPDLAAEANLPRAPVAAGAGLHGAVGFPVRSGVEFLGVLEFCSREIRQPDDELIQMMASIGSHISQFMERRQAEGELRRQEQDRRIARRIQEGLLPKAVPTFAGFQISGRSAPAQDVGGDCFDFLPLRVGGEECLGVLVADASGHGIGAALLVGQARAHLRALALACADVGTLLTLSNRRLASDLVTDHFVTLILLRLDPRTHSLLYASAGHWPGYVLDRWGRTKAVLAGTGGPLGIDPAGEFPTGPPATLEPGGLVFLFTDGIVEAASPDGQPFGLERTLGIVRAHQHETPDAILDALFDGVSHFSGHHLQDDITAVILKAEGVA